MSTLPDCPACKSGYTYEDRGGFVCPECAHESRYTPARPRIPPLDQDFRP